MNFDQLSSAVEDLLPCVRGFSDCDLWIALSITAETIGGCV